MTTTMQNIQWVDSDKVADEDFREYAEDKLQQLETMWPQVNDTHVRLNRQHGLVTAEVTLFSGALVTRGEERAENVRLAFDNAYAKIERQLRRYKKKSQARKRRHNNRDHSGQIANSTAGLLAHGETSEEEYDHDPVRVKKFAVKPMSAEEASLHMELLGHSFFVFRHAENNAVNVVYRRDDGGYGVIETVMD